MIFPQIDVNDGDIVYLSEYIPHSRCVYRDKRSEDLILAFKDKEKYAVDIVCSYLENNVGDDFSIVVIPSSKTENAMSSAMHLVAAKLSDIKDKNIVNASGCLLRKYDINTAHESKGKRTPQHLKESTYLKDEELIKGKDVLVLDDITTSGSSFVAASKLLKEAGAKQIINFAVGRTITKNNLKYGFIFNLENVLFDTSMTKCLCDEKSANDTIDKNMQPLDGVVELLAKISSLDYKMCIVTSYHEKYATALTEKLRKYINDFTLIAFEDTKQHKPNTEPYMKAKQIMQIFEPCITVFGNIDNDIIPAKTCNMTTVCINCKSKSQEAMYSFKNMKPANENFEKIIARASNVRNKLISNYEKNTQ